MLDAAEKAIREGASLLIASDRDVSPDRAPIPSLLVAGALQHGLLARRLRGEAGIVIESGEPREVMHFCLLCGYGANAVNPYLAFEAIKKLHAEAVFPPDLELEQLSDQYITAVKKGILKTMSKMGISTLRSYHSAQQFEAVGLNREVIDAYFHRHGLADRGRGSGRNRPKRHSRAIATPTDRGPPASSNWASTGNTNSASTARSIFGTRTRSRGSNRRSSAMTPRNTPRFAKEFNEQTRQLCTLRGLFEFVPGQPVPLDEVTPASEICKRFYTGAMSHGSISKEAHETMAIAMNRLGGMSNTGEGGEDPDRYKPRDDGDSSNCGIKQVASARFGVTIEYLSQAKVLQIKMAQGAKPGEGGQLPAHKVTEEIARLRHSTPGVSLISPPPHHDIYSIEDLAQLIYDLKCANPGRSGFGQVGLRGGRRHRGGGAWRRATPTKCSSAATTAARGPVRSRRSNTPALLGNSGWPKPSRRSFSTGCAIGFSSRSTARWRTGRDVVIGALLGAERFGFGTSALVALGCISDAEVPPRHVSGGHRHARG